MHSIADRRPVASLFLLVALAAFSFLVVTGTAEAKVKPKDGIYAKNPKANNPWGYVQTSKGKVVSASFYTKFKDSSGKCDPAGFVEYGTGSALWGQSLSFARPLAVNSKSKFSGKATAGGVPEAKVRISGKFLNKTKATLTYSVNVSGCKSSGTLKNAVFSIGG